MPDLTRWWILIISIIVGALSGVVGYISWLVALSDFKWRPWAGIGGAVGLEVGLIVTFPERFTRRGIG